jgi:hypothetical protein
MCIKTPVEKFKGAVTVPRDDVSNSQAIRQDYLSRQKNKTNLKSDKFKMPYVHGSNIKVKDEKGAAYDLDELKSRIKTRPSTILKQNEKMKHSDGTGVQYFNVGLPALKGLVVDETSDEFKVISTCPGAGMCQTICYAMKGSYVMFKDVSMKQSQTLNFLVNDPEGFKSEIIREINAAKKKFENKKFDGFTSVKVVIRWHDSGDFFSPEYAKLAFEVAEIFPDNLFYAYTKMADVANNPDKPKNFRFNFSAGGLSAQSKLVDIKNVKHSHIVPRELFMDLIKREGRNIIKDSQGRTQFKTPEDLDTFKDRMVDKYGIEKESILTYDEMMDIEEGDEQIYNVIVTPGTGDVSASRADVLGTYLLEH